MKLTRTRPAYLPLTVLLCALLTASAFAGAQTRSRRHGTLVIAGRNQSETYQGRQRYVLFRHREPHPDSRHIEHTARHGE